MTYTPYRIAVKKSFMTWEDKSLGRTLTAEEAESQIANESFKDLDGRTWASGSVEAAARGIAKAVNLSQEQTEKLVEVCVGKDDIHLKPEDEAFLKEVAAKFESLPNKGKEVVEILKQIHDQWVTDNYIKKFNDPSREGKKYQHLPLEMIGLPEAEFDLLFLSGVLDAMGVDVPMPEIQAAYDDMSSQFFVEEGFVNEDGIDKEAIAEWIEHKRASKYEALASFSDEEKSVSPATAKLMAGQVMEKTAKMKIHA